MTMTDTEAKALALVNEVFRERGNGKWMYCNRKGEALTEALCRAIEREAATEARNAAELRELKERFSEAASLTLRMLTPYPLAKDEAEDILIPFILPAPAPLDAEDPIDALVDLLAPVLTHSQGMAARERENRFRNAIAALKARGV